MTKRIFYTGLVVLLFMGCTYDKGDANIPTGSVTFIQPTTGAVLSKSGVISIEAIATSTAPLHGYDLAIRNTNGSVTYYFNHWHEHEDNLHIRQAWQSNLTAPAELEAEITLYLDHALHTHKQKVVFSVQ